MIGMNVPLECFALKRCSRCKTFLPLSDFSADKTRKDGYRSRCKKCGVIEASEWYRRRKHVAIAYYRKWLLTDAGKACQRRTNAKRQKERPEMCRAVRAVNNAIRDKRLFKGPCEVCGTTEQIQGHHDDYSKPLDVRWLCRRHHRELHGKQIWEEQQKENG